MKPDTGKENETETRILNEPFAGLVFKIATDPFVGRLAYIRIYSGKLEAGSHVLNPGQVKKRELPGYTRCMPINKMQKKKLTAGDICGAVGIERCENRGYTL